jgi:hypothetical protein
MREKEGSRTIPSFLLYEAGWRGPSNPLNKGPISVIPLHNSREHHPLCSNQEWRQWICAQATTPQTKRISQLPPICHFPQGVPEGCGQQPTCLTQLESSIICWVVQIQLHWNCVLNLGLWKDPGQKESRETRVSICTWLMLEACTQLFTASPLIAVINTHIVQHVWSSEHVIHWWENLGCCDLGDELPVSHVPLESAQRLETDSHFAA